MNLLFLLNFAYECVTILPVFVDAANRPVLKFLSVALDENLRTLKHHGQHVDDILHRRVVKSDEMPQEFARILLTKRILLFFLDGGEVDAIPNGERLPVPFRRLPAFGMTVRALVAARRLTQGTDDGGAIHERLLANRADVPSRPNVPFL